MVTDAGNQGQLPWLATLVTKVTTMVTTMVTMMVTTMVTTMVTITNLGYRSCVTDYYVHAHIHNIHPKECIVIIEKKCVYGFSPPAGITVIINPR